jgi:cytochrome c553
MGCDLGRRAAAAGAIVFLMSSAAGAAGEALQTPIWAYAIPTAPPRPAPIVDEDERLTLPGSGKTFTRAELLGLNLQKAPNGPADWYPDEHAPPPVLVSRGDMAPGGREIRPCSLCHYHSGKGKSENASVAGQPKAYLIVTLKDMRSGERLNAEPRKANSRTMYRIAASMTDEEIEEVAAYFSAMRWTRWIAVKESRVAPKVENVGGLMLTKTGADAAGEPLGPRIVETPVDAFSTEVLRDPHSGFIAYVPIGSIAAGRKIVARGVGGAAPCATCHGPGLHGIGAIPGLAARSPSYLARQLNDFRRGARHEAAAAMMEPIAKSLSDEDIVSVTAYLASLPPSDAKARP